MNTSVPVKQTIQYSTFFVGDLLFGVDVMQVQEVLRYQFMTKVLLAPPVVSGLINLRGQIVTAIDLRRRLNLAPRSEDQLPLNIVVRSGDGVVSFLVDQIHDVIEVNRGAFDRAPQNLSPEQRNLIDGLYKLDDQLLLVLNVEQALQVHSEAA